MKKLLQISLLMLMSFSLLACTTNENKDTNKTVTINTLNQKKETVTLEVPYDPQRIAILDMPALDIIDNLEIKDRIVGMASTNLDYLQTYATNENIVNIGTIKEPNLEAVANVAPDIIFIGGRLSEYYDELSKIAPVVYLAVDSNLGVVESTKQNALTIAKIFGKEAEVEKKFSGFTNRIQKLQEVANSQSAIVGMVTSGSFNVLGEDGRCSLISKEIGFDNIGLVDSTSTHGNESSFELIVKLSPQYLFVLDRDAAIATQGAKLAQEIVENELVKKTDVYKNGNIVYLEHPDVWYTAEGGITALDIMLQDLETYLIK